jgi:hypothetical protein
VLSRGLGPALQRDSIPVIQGALLPEGAGPVNQGHCVSVARAAVPVIQGHYVSVTRAAGPVIQGDWVPVTRGAGRVVKGDWVPEPVEGSRRAGARR